MESTEWLFSSLFPGQIGIWKCWFLWREENRSTRRKTLGARTRTDNKLNPHMTPRPEIEPHRATLVGGEYSHHCAIPAPTTHIILNAKDDVWMKFTGTNGRPFSSIGRVPDSRAGGRGYKPQPDQQSGSLNN